MIEWADYYQRVTVEPDRGNVWLTVVLEDPDEGETGVTIVIPLQEFQKFIEKVSLAYGRT